MARQLWLLRHGEAEPHSQRPDEQRVLTERGERQSRAAGAALAALGACIDGVYASPRVRALDTARLACEAFGQGLEPAVHRPLSAGFDAAQAVDLLVAQPHGAHVLLVGHEPDFSRLIAGLTGARVKLKKGGVAMIALEEPEELVGDAGEDPPSAGQLIVLSRPRELALIAGVAISEA